MTVKELIKRLSKCNSDAGVVVTDSDGANGFGIIDINEYGTVYIKASFSIDCGFYR